MKNLLLLLLIAQSLYGKASHTLGSEMYSEHVSGLKYNFYIKMYRDCSKPGLGNPSYGTAIYCVASGKSLGVSLSRVGIKEVSNRCWSSSNPCKVQNTQGKDFGIEEHIYRTTIDFSKAPYSNLVSCGKLELRSYICCRSTLLTTGAGTGGIYNSLQLNVKQTPANTSPKFTHTPITKVCYGTPTYLNFNAIDSDGDSLSYHLVDARLDSNKKVSYNSGLSGQWPIDVYDPTNKRAVSPTANPPVGFYLNESNGQVIFTPTKKGQGSIIRVKVKEWRKDTSGVYAEIGHTSREMAVVVIACSNIPPKITNTKSDYSICEGSELIIKVTAEDKVLVPPPPTPKPDPDTVSYFLAENYTTATLTKINSRSLSGPAYFRWNPPVGASSDKPYVFLITAQDNNCPQPLSVTKQFTITVQKAHIGSTSIRELACGKFELKATMDSAFQGKTTVDWIIYDGNMVMNDTNEVVFKSTNSSIGHNMSDTVTIRPQGTYYVRVQINNGKCNYVSFDTIHTEGSYYQFHSIPIGVCSKDSFTLKVDTNARKIYKYSEVSLNGVSGDSVTGFMNGGAQKAYLTSIGYYGCLLNDSVNIVPKFIPRIDAILDSIHCEPTDPIFSVRDEQNQSFKDTKFLWSDGTIGTRDTIRQTGQYWIRASNICGTSIDTFHVVFDQFHDVLLRDDLVLCGEANIRLYDRNYRDDVSYKWLGTSNQTSLYTVDTTGLYILSATTLCGTSYDSVYLEYLKPPKYPSWWSQTETYCDFILDTLDAANPGSTYLWNDGSTEAKKVVQKPGLTWVTISNICGVITASKGYDKIKKPTVNLGEDVFQRKNFLILLDAGKHDNAKYLWSTGSKNQSINVGSFGTYWVEVKNQCGTDKDTIEVYELLNVKNPVVDNLVLYPNPNNGEFYIEGLEEKIESIKLLNTVGEEVSISITEQDQIKKISVQNPCSGLFLLQIQTLNKQVIQAIYIGY